MTVITVSRLGGAGGRTLAKKISRKLGYSFVDREIIRMVAKQTNVSSKWVESIEKEAGNSLTKLIDGMISKNYFDRLLGDDKGYITEEIYEETLTNVISSIAKEGNAVILGRGGQFILKDHKDTFHILLVADRTDRINFMIKKHKFSTEKATLLIDKYEKRRKNMFKKFHKAEYNNPEHYHLVINTSYVSLEKALDLICDLVRP